jgi:type I restriction enzyme S subunit
MKTGWQTKVLGELCSFENGDRGENYPSKSVQTSSGVPFINAGHLTESGIDLADMNYIPRERFELLGNGKIRRNDVLFCLRGSLGKFASVGDLREGAIASSLVIIRPSEALLKEFLLIYLQSDLCAEMIHTFKNGAAQPNLAAASLKKFQIPVPPLSEQHRIVGILDEAFDGLTRATANAEQNLRNARALFEIHLQSVFTQRGEGWVETTLGEIGKVSMCKRIFKEETIATEGIPFYKIGTFGKEPDSFIPIRTYNEYRTKYPFPKKGDVLISASGTIGRRVRYDGEPAYFQDSNIVWIDNDENQVLNDYLYHFYSACEWNSTKGATISRLYNDNLRRIIIAFPESLYEQHRIVARLDALAAETQRLESIYQQKLAALGELKKSLLHQAFSGNL